MTHLSQRTQTKYLHEGAYVAEVEIELTDSDTSAVFAVSWFPADNRILYTYDGGGDELNHVIVREIDGTVVGGDMVRRWW